MLNATGRDMRSYPFPHLLQRDLFEKNLYEELKQTYPEIAESVGWRRMSKDLMRGDIGFETAVSQGAWKALLAYLNSADFLTLMIELFSEGLQSDDFLADPKRLRLTDYVETRQWIATHKVGNAISEYDGPLEDVFVRTDFGVGQIGYSRPPHLDWRHRICSVLIYFDDAQETQMQGGQFVVHDSNKAGSPAVEVIDPANNLGIFKLDSNRALHSVNEITAIVGERKTLFVGISSRGRVWR